MAKAARPIARLVRLLCVSLAIGAFSSPANAQTDYEAIVRIMRECAKISNVPSRVDCYDNTVKAERSISAASQPVRDGNVPSSEPSVLRSSAPQISAPASASPTGFGAESLPQASASRSKQSGKVSAVVASRKRVSPGVYVLTLDDGAQWQFVDTVSTSYGVPRKGSEIELQSAALGSFFMRYSGQGNVRIKRIR